MKLDIFSEGDSILLVGEGNFSFSVDLLKHQLPISLVTTCFEKRVSYSGQQENVDYLISKNVPVIFNVDATKLHENPHFRGKRFSKILFNFPHVGGKMKIQLNRYLLKNFFSSARHLVKEVEGRVLVSLCQGQGGTPRDEPRRNWNDSWQIAEMAGSGGFALVRIEPFTRTFFENYSCIGYRSQDVRFRLEGALVHVFAKRNFPFHHLTNDLASERLNLVPLGTRKNILVPVVYSELYSKYPLFNSISPVTFIQNTLLKCLSEANLETKFITDSDVPVHLCHEEGVECLVHSKRHVLRRDVFDVFDSVLRLSQPLDSKTVFFFPGMYFPLRDSRSFWDESPIALNFLVIGKGISGVVKKILEILVRIFQNEKIEISARSKLPDAISSNFLIKQINEFFCRHAEMHADFVSAVTYSVEYSKEVVDICVFDALEICKRFFNGESWKEFWSDETEVDFDLNGKPIMKPSILFPLSYSFDITLRYNRNDGFSHERMYELLWLGGGCLIESVELVNEYDSKKNWLSKCFRIKYRSWDKPMCREHAITLHESLIGRVLERGMNVEIG